MTRTNAFVGWGGNSNYLRTMTGAFRRYRNRLRILAVIGFKALRGPQRRITGPHIAGRAGRTDAGVRTNVDVPVLDAPQCRALAQEYKDRAREPDAPQDSAFIMKNIARSLMGLATQLEMLAEKKREETGQAH